MAARFCNITESEMDAFMKERNFRRMTIPGTIELVYGKIVNIGEKRLSLRVYSAINPTGESRAKGKDAIRVQLYYMYNEKPCPIGKSQKCLRVENWKANLSKAIDKHAENFEICPRCGHPMVERENTRTKEKFWGCVTYRQTKCNGKPVVASNNENTRSVVAASKPTSRSPYRIPDDIITSYQKEVERLFLETENHIMIGALAGSGKTAECTHLSSNRVANQLWQYIVFAKKNAIEGRSKFPRGIPVQTQHAFDSKWIRKCLPAMPRDMTGNKSYRLMNDVYPHMSNDNRKRIRRAVTKLVGFAKSYACRPGDLEAIAATMTKYDFELESQGEYDTVVEVTSEVLEKSLPQNCGHEYNFDDLLWWPVVLDLEVPKLHTVLADECQDFNWCQHDRLKRLADAGARIVAVGDRNQAVFRFRGADNDSFDRIKEILGSTERGCVEAELPENFRCGSEHIEYVRQHTCVKNIVAHKGAAKGKVITDMGYEEIMDMVVEELKA
jgi:ssDNA-binding Zn-finger/Zn-ribbon topoisomerase 1